MVGSAPRTVPRSAVRTLRASFPGAMVQSVRRDPCTVETPVRIRVAPMEKCYWLLVTGYSCPAADRESLREFEGSAPRTHVASGPQCRPYGGRRPAEKAPRVASNK